MSASKDPQAVVTAASEALKPSPRRLARAQVAIAACCFAAVLLLAASILSLWALLGHRHEAQVDFNRRFNAGLCQVVEFVADPSTPPDGSEVRFRQHYGCPPRSVSK
jgi:hypothetical protein